MQDYFSEVAVVTGTGSGIGKATAKLLAASGAQIIGAELSTAAGQRPADEITAQGEAARFMPLDVADPEAVEALFSSVKEERADLTCWLTPPGSLRHRCP